MNPSAPSSSIADAQSWVAADVRTLERDGYLILPGLLREREVQQLADELEPLFRATPHCVGDFYGWETTRVGGLLSKAPIVQHLALNTRILAIAETLLAPSCDCIQLNLTQATRVHPGEIDQAPHRDEEMWPWPTAGRHWLLNVMWAVSDFTAENGATRIWPKSRGQSHGRDADEAMSIAAEMAPGSALHFFWAQPHTAPAPIAHQRRAPASSSPIAWVGLRLTRICFWLIRATSHGSFPNRCSG